MYRPPGKPVSLFQHIIVLVAQIIYVALVTIMAGALLASVFGSDGSLLNVHYWFAVLVVLATASCIMVGDIIIKGESMFIFILLAVVGVASTFVHLVAAILIWAAFGMFITGTVSVFTDVFGIVSPTYRLGMLVYAIALSLAFILDLICLAYIAIVFFLGRSEKARATLQVTEESGTNGSFDDDDDTGAAINGRHGMGGFGYHRHPTAVYGKTLIQMAASARQKGTLQMVGAAAEVEDDDEDGSF